MSALRCPQPVPRGRLGRPSLQHLVQASPRCNLCGNLQRRCRHCYTPTQGATGCAASGCRERQYAAPEFTDSRRRRFSTQISTQRAGAAKSRHCICWSRPRNEGGRWECVTSLPSWSCGFDSRRPLQLTGLFRFAIQLAHVHPVYWPTRLPVAGAFPVQAGIMELNYVNVRSWLDYPSFYPKCQQP